MIEIRQLYKYYGKHRAVGPIDVTIEQGEIVGLLGLNGAGKSTTIRMLACDLLPTAGTIRVEGFDVVEQPQQVRKLIGYLPDVPPLYPEMRVGEYLRFAARLRGLDESIVGKHVAEAEERTGIAHVDGEPIGTLSHGYRQRVGIAQALVHDPPFILLDEPIAGLDPEQIMSTRKLIKSLGGGHTVLISSHILSEISQTCDRLLVIRDGRIVASGTEDELFATAGERTHIHVQFRRGAEQDTAQTLRSMLADLPWVQQVQQLHVDGQGLVDCRLVLERDMRGELARQLVQSGHELLTLTRAERELENVFLQIANPHGVDEPSNADENGTTDSVGEVDDDGQTRESQREEK